MKRVVLFIAAVLLPAAAAAQAARIATYDDAPALERACADGLAKVRKTVDAMAAKPGPAGIFDEWNRMFTEKEDAGNAIYLYAAIHPDKALRTAAEGCVQKFTALDTEISQNEKLFARVRAARPAHERQAKLQRDLLRDFEDAGVSLPPDKRARAKQLLEKIEENRLAFIRNSRDDPTRVTFTPAEMEGLPDGYLKARKPDASGNYVLGLDQPSFGPFMQNARSGAARERYYRARYNQGGAKNLDHLNDIFLQRQELAALYGLPTFAHYGLRRKMAQKPENVMKFLNEVRTAITEVEKKELEELRQVKARDLGTPLADTKLTAWDVSYYAEKLRRERHSVDQEKLRAYFPADKSVDFVLLLTNRLYGVKFVEGKADAWHPDVRYFEMQDADGKYMGNLYVDLFPREGKRQGAFAAPLRSASRLTSRTPSAALVCNFSRQGFNQQELTTLLHEFGHALNMILSNVEYAPQAISTVKWDFVEAPSQMFEEWARREQSLALFRQVCPQCPQLTSAEVKQLEAARRFGQAYGYGFQWLLSAFDMELSQRPRPPLQVWKELAATTPMGYVEGTMHPASFQHITGAYGAGYYGYMWSRVIARDLLSQFDRDLLDPKVGARYRETILGAGVEREESEMVRRFLGREPNPKAFFDEITGKS